MTHFSTLKIVTVCILLLSNYQSVYSHSSAEESQTSNQTGTLMIMAWMIFVTIAIIFARYMRDERSIWGKDKIWFLVHRTLNLIGIALMTAGFVCIFVSKHWTWTGPTIGGGERNWRAGAIHSLVGLTCVILAWTQVLVAFFRCSPTSSNRPLFNCLHRSMGIAAWLLAVTAITIAVFSFHHWASRGVAQALLVIIILCLFGTIGLGEITSKLEQVQKWPSYVVSLNNNLTDYSNSNKSRLRCHRTMRIMIYVSCCIILAASIMLSGLVVLS